MIEHIFHVIKKYHMIEPGMRVIAGVSGGADSVCLLRVLADCRHKLPFDLLAVHVEHGLRGRESLEDAVFVENMCRELRVPCRVVHAQVRQRAEAEKLSCEEAGRAERYRIFRDVAGEWGADRIAVAHNQNDQAETVLWNLARGSGLRGLGGIRPMQGSIIRPLLFTERSEIETWLRGEGIPWRTDRTNLETDFTRNRIRLHLLPQMEKELNGQAGRHIAEAAGRLQEIQDYVDKKTDEAAAKCLREDAGASAADKSVWILLDYFNKEETLIREELLKRALQKSGGMKDVGAVHLKALERLADMDCGKSCDLPGGIRAVRENGVLRFVKRKGQGEAGLSASGFRENGADFRMNAECREEILLPVPGRLFHNGFCVTAERMENTPELKKIILEEKKYTKWFSYDTITNSLLLRTRKTGDYLVINAQGGTQKLKDYMIDRKIPRDQRDQIPVLADGSHILWVVGWRISEAAKVTDATEHVIKIQIAAGTGRENRQLPITKGETK
ncbi:MAG: tRNA lysidine(34) synthetase TilS [Lachnospiraceae bacterium]|nr:tRNA lysidine(34) synthetase TilS [Lachnospiraceae bacterium]